MQRVLGRTIGAAVVLVLGATSVALAAYTSSPTATGTYSTGTVSPPTSLAAAAGPCTVGVSASIPLTWTASASAWADGYEVQRSLVSGGPYTSVATVSGAGTTTYTDGPLTFSTTYYYVVRTTKAAWRSVASNQASLTTLSLLCL